MKAAIPFYSVSALAMKTKMGFEHIPPATATSRLPLYS
jgi:hypothetical protein